MSVLLDIIRSSESISPRTRETYEYGVIDYLNVVGDHPGCWTYESTAGWQRGFAGRGLSKATRNTYLAAVRHTAALYAARGHGENFAAAVKKIWVEPTLQDHKRRSLTYEQSLALLRACEDGTTRGVRDRAIIMFGLREALRRSEIARLELGENIVLTKRGKRHRLELDAETREALDGWTRFLRGKGISRGRVFRSLRSCVHRSGWVVGDAITPRGVYGVVARRGRAAGIEGLHPHMLRSTFATLAIKAGSPLAIVRSRMGHSDDRMTLHYAGDLAHDSSELKLPTMLRPEFPT